MRSRAQPFVDRFFHDSRPSLLLIIFLGVLVYSNTLHVPFYLDDESGIVINPVVQDLNSFLDPSILASNRVVGNLTFSLNYALHGLSVTGYHVFNGAIHILNALLVYRLALLTFRTPFFSMVPPPSFNSPDCPGELPASRFAALVALFAALFFVSHPVQTQAVTYTIQRFTSLATSWYLLSLLSYIVSRNSPKPARRLATYAFSILFAVLAMKTKEIAFTLPVTIALYEFLFFDGKTRTRMMRLIPFLLTMFIIPVSLLGADITTGQFLERSTEVSRIESDLSRTEYLLTQFRVIVTYVRLLFFPVNQMLDYDYPIYHSFFDPGVYLSFLFLLSLVVLSGYGIAVSRTRHAFLRVISFGILWFFITLSVESSIIPIVDVIFEHRVYLPSIGFMLAMSTALVAGMASLPMSGFLRTIGRPAILLLVAAGLASLSIAAYKRNEVWGDKLTFWEDGLRKSPRKARAYSCLGDVYLNTGRVDKAIELYKTAVALQPDYLYGQLNLGFAYYCAGRTMEAIDQYELVLRASPDMAQARLNLSLAYKKLGMADKAEEQRQLARRLNRGLFTNVSPE